MKLVLHVRIWTEDSEIQDKQEKDLEHKGHVLMKKKMSIQIMSV
jgi:hypothetical protein